MQLPSPTQTETLLERYVIVHVGAASAILYDKSVRRFGQVIQLQL